MPGLHYSIACICCSAPTGPACTHGPAAGLPRKLQASYQQASHTTDFTPQPAARARQAPPPRLRTSLSLPLFSSLPHSRDGLHCEVDAAPPVKLTSLCCTLNAVSGMSLVGSWERNKERPTWSDHLCDRDSKPPAQCSRGLCASRLTAPEHHSTRCAPCPTGTGHRKEDGNVYRGSCRRAACILCSYECEMHALRCAHTCGGSKSREERERRCLCRPATRAAKRPPRVRKSRGPASCFP